MNKTPLALLLAGAAIGGLIAMSSSTPPPSLEARELTTPTTVQRAATGSTFDAASLAPIVDEPKVAGNQAVTPPNAVGLRLVPGAPVQQLTITAAGRVVPPATPTPTTAARPAASVAGTPAAQPAAAPTPAAPAPAATPSRAPSSPVFATPAQ